MSHFLYIIHSESSDTYYKGETVDFVARLIAHNSGASEFTRNKAPWRLVYLEQMADRKTALKKEKEFKRLNRRSILKLINGETNQLNKLIG